MRITSAGGPAAATLVALAWLAVAVGGGAELGFGVTPLAAAAAAGVALLAGWLPLPEDPAGAARSGLALLALPLATASAVAGQSVLPLCAVALALAILDRPTWERPHALAGAAALALAAVLVWRAGGGWMLPTDLHGVAVAVLAGAALILVVAAVDGSVAGARDAAAGPMDDDPPGARLTLLVPALVAGLTALPLLAPAAGLAGAGALAAVLAWRSAPPAAVVGLTAIAVSAAGPGLRPAAVLLAAAAVLAGAIRTPGAVILAVPGAIATVIAVDGLMTAEAAGAAAVLGAVTLVLVVRTDWSAIPEHLATLPLSERDLPRALPAALGAWLVVAPGSWGVAGAPGLRPYDRGALIAVASALVAVAVAGAWPHLPSVRFGGRRQ